LFLFTLIVLNSIVFMGQLWLEGAPPFALGVNDPFLEQSPGLLGYRSVARIAYLTERNGVTVVPFPTN
jgi:hypothetical protein